MSRPFSWGRDRQQTYLQSCAQKEDIPQQVAELQEVARRLHNVREADELDSWFQAVCSGTTAKEPKTPPLAHTEERGDNNAE